MLVMLKKLAAAIAVPAAGKVALFVDAATGQPSYKDEAGTVTSLKGAAGPGVPAGGTAGQVLAKVDGADYNATWATPSTGGMANPMTTAGDLIVGGASGAPGRLAKGTDGQVMTMVAGAPAWAAAPSGGGGSLAYLAESLNTASPYGTVNLATYAVQGGTTNVSLALVPKGNGAFQLATGGNARGTNAVDLQLVRGSSAQVAGGPGAFAAGSNNTASGSQAVAVGDSNTASGAQAVALGYLNTASASQSVAQGRNNAASGTSSVALGQDNVASGQSSVALGRDASTQGIYGKKAFASGYVYRGGGNQRGDYVLRGTTSDATAVALGTDGSTGGGSNQVKLSDRSAFAVTGTVMARNPTTGDSAAWEVKALVKREAGAATTTVIGATVTQIAADAGAAAWACTLVADTTNGALSVRGAGAAATSVRWNAVITANELITA